MPVREEQGVHVHTQQSAHSHTPASNSSAQVVSDSEKMILDRFNTGIPVHIVSNIYEPQGSSFQCEGRQGLLFVGNMAHEPNRCALCFQSHACIGGHVPSLVWLVVQCAQMCPAEPWELSCCWRLVQQRVSACLHAQAQWRIAFHEAGALLIGEISCCCIATGGCRWRRPPGTAKHR